MIEHDSHLEPFGKLLCGRLGHGSKDDTPFGKRQDPELDRKGTEWHLYTMTYDFVTWQEDGIWSSHAPSVPGVYGLGSTADRAERDLMEALETMSEYLDGLGEKLPRARTVRLGQIRI